MRRGWVRFGWILFGASCASRTEDVASSREVVTEVVAVRRDPTTSTPPAATAVDPITMQLREERDDVDRGDDFVLEEDGTHLARAPITSRGMVAVGAADPPALRLRPGSTVSLVVRDGAAERDARGAMPGIQRALSRCHALVLASAPRAAGNVVLVFTVDAQGAVVQARANPDDDLGPGRACFERETASARFAPARAARRTITFDAALSVISAGP